MIKQWLCKSMLAASLAGLAAAPALADWTLDDGQSSLHFVSVKNDAIAEAHYFEELSGGIDASGKATVEIELASVESAIPIRNERMRDMLFNVAKMPTATITADIDPELLETLAPGELLLEEVALTVDLNGTSKSYPATLRISVLEEGSFLAVTETPIMLNAADHGLDTGIEKLREVAGLNAIATAVPVTAALVFREKE
ncbi:YceI family protein [Marinimicrobium sp. ARAG 43.8]|uniref:YceI family protein n=1 Tax=Marinimicrobium sp. ARAG 43.8 TaxID=3418719 RepID=UPI003CE7DEC3